MHVYRAARTKATRDCFNEITTPSQSHFIRLFERNPKSHARIECTLCPRSRAGTLTKIDLSLSFSSLLRASSRNSPVDPKHDRARGSLSPACGGVFTRTKKKNTNAREIWPLAERSDARLAYCDVYARTYIYVRKRSMNSAALREYICHTV